MKTTPDITKPASKGNTDLLPFHPLSKKFELLQGADFDRLIADIHKRGLKEPIVRYEGMILDGRNRYRACLKAKVEPKYRDFEGSYDEAAADVESANFHRRHMTPSQKRAHVEELLKANPARSDRSIAEEAKTDHKVVSRVRKQLEARGATPHVDKRTDTKGRQQPAKRAKRTVDDFVADIQSKTVESSNPSRGDRGLPVSPPVVKLTIRLLTELMAHGQQADPINVAQAMRKEHAAESITKLVDWLDGFMTEIKNNPTAPRSDVVVETDTVHG